jgi:hypothetical protein
MRSVYISPYVYHGHYLAFELFKNPVDSVSRWCNTNRKRWPTLSLHSSARTTRRLKDFDNKRFLIRRIRYHLGTQLSVVDDNKQVSQVCRTICERFIQLRSITKVSDDYKKKHLVHGPKPWDVNCFGSRAVSLS